MGKFNELSGKIFGKLTVIKRNGSDKYSKPMWLCMCDCGKEKTVLGRRLVSGKTKSCGCLTVSTHGMSKHPLWGVWNQMIQRCYNPNHKSYIFYGAKGINVCDEWRHSSSIFFEWAMTQWDVGLTIDRIDDRLGYFPDNCRFISLIDNVMRKRITGKNVGKVFGTWRITGKVPGTTKMTVECIKCKFPYSFEQGNITTLKCRQCKCK